MLFVAGEHCDVGTLEWSKKVFKVPVLDHWWQTGEYFKLQLVKYSDEIFSNLVLDSAGRSAMCFHL